jgi:hypothetical protein
VQVPKFAPLIGVGDAGSSALYQRLREAVDPAGSGNALDELLDGSKKL